MVCLVHSITAIATVVTVAVAATSNGTVVYVVIVEVMVISSEIIVTVHVGLINEVILQSASTKDVAGVVIDFLRVPVVPIL